MSNAAEAKASKNLLYSDEFIRRIPKANLHCHLDGSIRVQTIIDLAKQQGVTLPAYTVEELHQLVFKDDYNNLDEYLVCFKYASAIMRTPEALERIAFEFAEDAFDDGVRYFEVRFAPQLHVIPGQMSLEDVLLAVDRGLNRAKQQRNSTPAVVNGLEPAHDYAIIVCAMRFFTPSFAPYFKSFMEMHKHESPTRVYGLASMALVTAAFELKRTKGIPIVALDIAGAEKGFPNDTHTEAFAYAHKKFLHKTVHAGEDFGPESIFQAITDLHAERIGHGLSLFDKSMVTVKDDEQEKEQYVRELADFVAHSRVCVEVCLTCNSQTAPQIRGRLKQNHPFRKMLDHKVSVSLCTDNNTVSKTSMSKEVRLAVDTFELTPKELKDIIVTGFKRSFMNCPYQEKRAYNRSIIEYYEQLEREFNITTGRIA